MRIFINKAVELARRFPGGVIVFDSCNSRGAKMMIRFCDRYMNMQIIRIAFKEES